jgi:hypothetical protein
MGDKMIRAIFSFGEVAKANKVPTRFIPDLIYRGAIDSDRLVMVGCRRFVPLDYLPEVEAVIQAARAVYRPRKTANVG